MTGAECNVDCGDNSASEDEESREPLNQVNKYILKCNLYSKLSAIDGTCCNTF